MRRAWVSFDDELPVLQQCQLAGVNRSTVYAQAQQKTLVKVDPVVHATAGSDQTTNKELTAASGCVPAGAAFQNRLTDEDLVYCRLIDGEYTRRPYYGTRRMVVFLRQEGHQVNRKRVQRLMRIMGLAGMAPGPNTSKPHPGHKVFPYRLRGVSVVRPNQVWSTDITYVRLERGFVYLVAIIDWYSRRVLSWRLSNTMDASFCVDCLEEALMHHGKPEVFNSDQGSQFTSESFIKVLQKHDITISMDGRGRALDNIFVERLWRNVKYECVYLNGYANVTDLIIGLTEYFSYYNNERPHQALGYRTPKQVYSSAENGGASIPDNYTLKESGQRRPAENNEMAVA